MRKCSSAIGLAALGVFALATMGARPASAGPDPAEKCAAAKIKAAGKKAKCLLGLEAKEASKGDPIDGEKLQKCRDKLTASFAKAEAKGGCATSDDAGDIETKVDAFVADVDSELAVGTPNSCQGAKIKAAGKKAKCLLGVEAKGAQKGTAPDGEKVQKCRDKLTTDFAKKEAGDDCATIGDADDIETKVDMFVADVVAELPTAPPTTSTTTTLPFCGNGFVEGGEACDDGNAFTGDGCRPDCTHEVCGDGIQDPQEQCDDGGTTPGDGCNELCEAEGSTCAPLGTARRIVRVDLDTPEALAGVRVDLEYPQVHASLPGMGNSSLVRSRITIFPSGGLNTVNDHDTDLTVVLANATPFIDDGPLFEASFDQCTALAENMCNRTQNVISCCNDPSDPTQFGDFCQRGECANMPGTSCTLPTPLGTDCGSMPAECMPKPCTGDASCTGGFGLCVFKCPGNPPVCPVGTFPTGTTVGPCTSTPGGCPGDNACITQTSNTTCTVSEPVDQDGQAVAGVTCSVTITEMP